MRTNNHRNHIELSKEQIENYALPLHAFNNSKKKTLNSGNTGYRSTGVPTNKFKLIDFLDQAIQLGGGSTNQIIQQIINNYITNNVTNISQILGSGTDNYVAFVDAKSGDDLTAEVGNISKPFATIYKASLAAYQANQVAGKDIHSVFVFSGEYVVDDIITESTKHGTTVTIEDAFLYPGVPVFCLPNVTIKNTSIDANQAVGLFSNFNTYGGDASDPNTTSYNLKGFPTYLAENHQGMESLHALSHLHVDLEFFKFEVKYSASAWDNGKIFGTSAGGIYFKFVAVEVVAGGEGLMYLIATKNSPSTFIFHTDRLIIREDLTTSLFKIRYFGEGKHVEIKINQVIKRAFNYLNPYYYFRGIVLFFFCENGGTVILEFKEISTAPITLRKCFAIHHYHCGGDHHYNCSFEGTEEYEKIFHNRFITHSTDNGQTTAGIRSEKREYNFNVTLREITDGYDARSLFHLVQQSSYHSNTNLPVAVQTNYNITIVDLSKHGYNNWGTAEKALVMCSTHDDATWHLTYYAPFKIGNINFVCFRGDPSGVIKMHHIEKMRYYVPNAGQDNVEVELCEYTPSGANPILNTSNWPDVLIGLKETSWDYNNSVTITEATNANKYSTLYEHQL